MSRVSDDPSWWPLIDFAFNYSYCVVASSVLVVYDWVLTSGQEFDLVWSQPWSLITVLYLCVRCLGVLYCGTSILWSLSSVSMKDTVTVS
ncbi:hypothetical protein CY34DRAFT_393123 [Suillus luteus UH-Slu-Lm8-n1]|uniref:DUF6533 domain-containing protein n=1 Tax=Suillus luteus UH-Slu-Lm8-n1 TaxID=930992 RepID=A0A0D0B3N9_9AGAM|nr:hypothetical protein CY34DRAFT_393123 [Suillus luteus UH-Slu-Lm8-n1]